ncbi:MAG: hypothetical protein KC800_02235 [Candidatus Eremiobacteraeota bacterium]|nr:hypothetical protein [Candidatus Eremiobacteraeota bacterium]
MESFLESYPWVFPLVFISMWIFVSKMLAKVGGWQTIATLWPAPSTISVSRRYLKAGVFGSFCRYNGVLITGATKDGLYLDVLLPFRIGHKALLIPWDQLELICESKWLAELKTSSGQRFSLQKSEFDKLIQLAKQKGAEVSRLVR